MALNLNLDLEETLDLKQIANCDIFVGQPIPAASSPPSPTRTHLFGGLIAAQSVVAASRTVPPSHRIHSLHSYFILAGDGRLPILFHVDRIRDGSSFKTRQVLAKQENRPIFMMIASFHVDEPGPEFQKTPEELKALSTLMPEDAPLQTPTEMIAAGKRIEYSPSTAWMTLLSGEGRNHSLVWRKSRSQLRGIQAGDDSWVLHAAVLTFMSDMGLLSTVRMPYHEVPISMATSLDHSIHFHRKFLADDWLLFHNQTTASSGGRGVARTEVWTETGYLVASFMQEGLVRPSREWKPKANPLQELEVAAARTHQILRAKL